MDRHSIVLRAANPTFDEGLAFARYADEAAEGSFDSCSVAAPGA